MRDFDAAAERRAVHDWRRYAVLWRLAWPAMLSRAGILLMALVDIVMVGHYSRAELAYASIGMSLFIPILVAGIGLMVGVMIQVSQAYGRGDRMECGAVFLRGLPWAVTVGMIGAAVCALSEVWLLLLGQTPDLAAGGGAVAQAVALGVPGQLGYVVCAYYLEATGRTRPAFVAMIAANLLNVALNWVLIYGNLGAPELGAVGSALTTALIRVFLFGALLAYIVSRPDAADYGLEARGVFDPGRWLGAGFWGPGGWRAGAAMRRLGWAAGVSTACEAGAYATVTQFAGWMGEDVLAAYAVAYNVEAICFMVALGLGTATAVLVGAALGRGDLFEADEAAWTGIGAVSVMMAALALGIWLFKAPLAALYTSDQELAARVVPLLPFIGGVILLDGAQLVMAQSVRALGDAWSATRRFAIAFWLILTPGAYFWGVIMGLGAKGLMIGVMIGCAASLLMQMSRFQQLIRANVARRDGRMAASAPVDPSG